MDASPGRRRRSRRSSTANDRSIRRLTVRGATGDTDLLAKSRADRGRPEFRAFLEREFPEGASELPEGVTRRDMMMLLGASLSLAGLAGCRRPVEEIVPYVTAPEEIVPGIPRYYATTMPFRRSAYGLIVESHEGRPTKIEGNPSPPLDPRGLELARPGVRARPLRSRPLAIGHAAGCAEVLERFRDGLGAAVRGSCRGWRRRPCGPLRVLLLSHPGAPGSELRARYPRLQWATYDAVSDENRLAGLRHATGRDLDLMLRLDRASVILALDADPLLTDPEMIRHARGSRPEGAREPPVAR